MPGSATDTRLAIGLFVVAFIAFCWCYGGSGSNQNANFDLTRALIERGTLYIDGYSANTGDVATGVGGHIYINKAPGVSFLAAVPYAVLRADKRLVTVAVTGTSGALIGPVLFLYGRRKAGAPRFAAMLATLSILFGTIVFAYSTMLFAHVPSALFLLLAFALVRERPLAAGLAAGAAGACFYLSAVAAVALIPLAWSVSRRSAARYVAGGFVFAIALAVYHQLCFGSPLRTPVETSTVFIQKDLLLGVFGRPRPSVLWKITFAEYRGLFYCSPVLLFAFAGAAIMLRRRRMVGELTAIGSIVVLYLLGVSSFNGWHGGWAFGPRYLLPIVPLLGVPMMFAAERAKPLWVAVGLLSLAINFAGTTVDPMVPQAVARPIRGYLFPVLLTQRLPDDTRVKLYPGCPTSRCTPNKVALAQDSWNLGERLLGKGRLSSVIPLLLWIVTGSTVLLVIASRAERHSTNGSSVPLARSA